MNCLKFAVLLLFFFSLCVFVSEAKGKHRPGRSKDDKRGKLPKTSLQELSTCMGEPVDLKSQIESAAQQCLDTRIQEIQEHVEANENGKAARKEKRKEKLAKKLRKKCLSECEWKTFELIPDVNVSANENVSYPSTIIPEAFLKIFPQNAQSTLESGMESCYNTTLPMFTNEGKQGLKEKMCFTNVKLIKCLGRSVRQTCKRKGALIQPSPGTGNATATAPTKSGSGNVTVAPSGQIVNDDNDDSNDDDDKDDEDNGEDESTTAKITPSTSVNTSVPITK